MADGGSSSWWKEAADIGRRQAGDGRQEAFADGGEEGAGAGREEGFVEVSHQGREWTETRECRLGLGSDGPVDR